MAEIFYVLKFHESSYWPGKFVMLDSYSGGYPCATVGTLNAKKWATRAEALTYAEMFPPFRGSYKDYAIEPVAYTLRMEIVS